MKLLLTIILFDTFCYFDLTNIIYTFYFYAFVFLFFPLKKISSLSFHFICSLLSSTRHLSTQMPLLHTDVFAVCISTVKDGFNNLSSNQQLKLQTGTSCVCMDKVGHFYWSIKAGSSGGADGARVWQEGLNVTINIILQLLFPPKWIRNIEARGMTMFVMTHRSCYWDHSWHVCPGCPNTGRGQSLMCHLI